MIDYLNEENLILYEFEDVPKVAFNLQIGDEDNIEKIIQNKRFSFLEISAGFNCQKKEFETHYIGFTIIEFLNNFETICNICNKYEDRIKKSNDNFVTFEIEEPEYEEKAAKGKQLECQMECQIILDSLINELYESTYIRNCAPFLINDIYNFRYDFFQQMSNYIRELQKQIEKGKLISNKNNEYIVKLEKQLRELTTSAYTYKNKTIDFIEGYKRNLLDLYDLFTHTYMPEYKEYKDIDNKKYNLKVKVANKYVKEDIQLPSATIKLDKYNKKNIKEYNYKIFSLKELGIISLYHIMLSNKEVKKCRYCGNFFVPKSKKEVYCDRLQRIIETKEITNATNDINIIKKEKSREVVTEKGYTRTCFFWEENKLTGEKTLLKKEHENNCKYTIKNNTIKEQVETEITKNGNIVIKQLQQSCKDFGKKQAYSNKLSEAKILHNQIDDRIERRIKHFKKINDLPNLQKFEGEKAKLEKLYEDVFSRYNIANEKFYSTLLVELTKFDYNYIQKYPSKYKPYTSINYWDKNTKEKLDKKKK